MRKKKSELSVWHWGACKSYYLKRPWKWLKELFINIKSAHDRATKGYCDLDWLNFDMWFKRIVPCMLKDMAQYSHGYPGHEPFETPEKWYVWLHKIANQFISCQDEDTDNEYYEPYMAMLEQNMERNSKDKTGKIFDFEEESEKEKELREKYHKRWEEVNKEHKELFKQTMEELTEYFDCLWD